MVERLLSLFISLLITLLITLLLGTPVGAQETPTPTQPPTTTPTPPPTTTPILVAPSVPLEYQVVTGTNQIAADLVALGTPDAPEQPILFGFGALMLGCFVLVFVRAMIGGGL